MCLKILLSFTIIGAEGGGKEVKEKELLESLAGEALQKEIK